MKQSLNKRQGLPGLLGGTLIASLMLAGCNDHNGVNGGPTSTATAIDVGGKSVEFKSSAGTLGALQLVAAPAGTGTLGLQFPNGFFSYNVTGLTNGQSVTVSVTLPAGSSPTQVIKCINGVCSDLVALGKASVAGDVITLTLKDGEAATDADGVANGTITDPFGAARVLATGSAASGITEPLYTYQWALKKAGSYFAGLTDTTFADDGNDLDVEPVHTATFGGSNGKAVKGAGVNVLVLDDGIDIRNEDLLERVDVTQTRNFDFLAADTGNSEFGKFRSADLLAKDDPTPVTQKLVKGVMTNVNTGASHGTNVAGMILASQNGKGVMGIAPAATLGGASFLATINQNTAEAYGGGSWAQKADVINASFGSNPATPPDYDPATANQALRGLANLRGGKGAPFLKASGNEFGGSGSRNCTLHGGVEPIKGIISCENPANDTEALEPSAIVIGAVNAAGVKSSYSNAGGVNWVMGLGGEYGSSGDFGEGKGDSGTDGPAIFSTDLRGCSRGYSNNLAEGSYAAVTNFLKGLVGGNTNCDYSYMNGTSAATPTVTGVVALMLSVNPNLGWRDVREILAATAKPIDTAYATRVNPNTTEPTKPNYFSLMLNRFTADSGENNTCYSEMGTGDKCAMLDRGYQDVGGTGMVKANGGAALKHSQWYGFGLVDAGKAVATAKAYTDYLRTTITADDQPEFAPVKTLDKITYGQVSDGGTITIPAALNGKQVDQLQLRISADEACMGSIGFIVRKHTIGPQNAPEIVLSTPVNTFSNREEKEGGGFEDAVTSASNYTIGSYGYFGAKLVTDDQYQVFVVARTPNGTGDESDTCKKTSDSPANLKIEWRILPRVLDLKSGTGVAATETI